jgi:hypothetical protein
MKSGMSTQPIAVVDLVFEKINDLGDGSFTGEANNLFDPRDGRHKYGTVSVQEDGSIQQRDVGTTGAFERFLRVDSKTVQFSPRGTKAYLFAFSAGLINS